MSTPGVERGREYTVQEIAEERRYQEQCFLLYWLQYLATENKHTIQTQEMIVHRACLLSVPL